MHLQTFKIFVVQLVKFYTNVICGSGVQSLALRDKLIGINILLGLILKKQRL